MLKLCHPLRFATVSSVFALSLFAANAALAQQTNSGTGAHSLPSVVVSAPEQRRTAAAAARRNARPVQTATSRKPQPKHAAAFVENPRGGIEGYVAGRSMAGTKTNTAIMEMPQAISVVGREQIRRLLNEGAR